MGDVNIGLKDVQNTTHFWKPICFTGGKTGDQSDGSYQGCHDQEVNFCAGACQV